jgi:Protein of unknown function (DUF998)
MKTASRQCSDDQSVAVLPGSGNAPTSATLATPKLARWLALGAVAGPVLFTLAWLILGFLSPGYTAWGVRVAPYSPISQGISGLGLGDTAPYMNTAFVLCGVLLLAGAVGVFQSLRQVGAAARWTCAALLALAGLGAAMDGIFTLESFFLHFIGFGLACGVSVVGFLVLGFQLRRLPRWRRFGSWLLLGSPLTLALIILYFLTFTPTVAGTQTGVAGLTERLLAIEVFAWFVTLGWLAFRRS